jgi:hypothetical protein
MRRTLALVLAVAATGIVATAGSATPRSGALHVTKECSQYDGDAGDFCTITTSNINTIKPGSNVIYASAAGDPTPGVLDSDLVVDGPGNNNAHGHVVLDLATLTGIVTLSGGSGAFRGFQASVDVSLLGWPDFAWDGTYNFDPPR